MRTIIIDGVSIEIRHTQFLTTDGYVFNSNVLLNSKVYYNIDWSDIKQVSEAIKDLPRIEKAFDMICLDLEIKQNKALNK